MHFFKVIEQFIREIAFQVPLPWFVFFGSFFEEVVSPIPSALIMGTAGSLALLHGEPLWYLVFLAAFGNIGKTFGAWFYYFLGDKLEDLLIGRLGRFFGVTHKEIENIGRRFQGHHWKDGGLLFLLRLIPFVPTTPVSIAAGIIKLDLRVFLLSTYAGNFVKDLFYIYAGYAGLASLRKIWHTIAPLKLGADIAVAVGIAAFLFFLYVHRGRGQRLIRHCGEHCQRLLDHFSKGRE